MCCLRGNSTRGDILAILIQQKYPPQKCKLRALEEITEGKFQVRDRCELQKYSGSTWNGLIAAFKFGVAVIQKETSILHVWQVGDTTAHEFNIPDGPWEIVGMCEMENVFGRDEIIALAISNNNSIGFYAIDMKRLVKVRDIQLEFELSRLLWLESKRTLLISDNEGNQDEIFALRVWQHEFTSYKVKIDDKESFDLFSWCVLPDKDGNEKAIALFDFQCDSVKIFHLL